MRTFIYIVTDSSPKRGYNRSIRVYEIVNNYPVRIGDDDKITTSSYKGDRPVACQIIADNTDLELDNTGYRLSSEDVVSEI